jgi:hypothetical protein
MLHILFFDICLAETAAVCRRLWRALIAVLDRCVYGADKNHPTPKGKPSLIHEEGAAAAGSAWHAYTSIIRRWARLERAEGATGTDATFLIQTMMNVFHI